MKRLHNTARNIFVMDDEATFGATPELELEQPQTAPVAAPVTHSPIASNVQSLRTLLTHALEFLSVKGQEVRDELLNTPSILSDDMTDTLVTDDHLIPLLDDEPSGDSVSTAVSVLDSINESLAAGDDANHTPLILSAFKRKFLG